MKLEDLLEWSSDQIKALSDAQLLELAAPYRNVTRPEFAPKPKNPSHKPTAVAATPQFAKKIEQLKAMGLDISLDDFKKSPRGKKK